uniref:Uncharacterized protein n=1 Tax=Arundo donax TaxID=35708 RepID=A0A0A9FI62_ARUDO
MRRMRFILTGR